MKPEQDRALLRRLAAGDTAAYGQLYDRYAPAMLRTAAMMLGSVHDAQDAVQEVFLSLTRGRGRLATVRNLRAYLFTALRHECGRQATRRGPTMAHEFPDIVDATRARPDEPDDRLARALEALSDEQREVLALKIDAEMTFAELALALGISPNTAASRYRYALEKLRASLEN